MKTILLCASAVIALALAKPAHSQTVLTCEVIGDYIPVGETFPVDYEPAYIGGSTPGSRVNVKPMAWLAMLCRWLGRRSALTVTLGFK